MPQGDSQHPDCGHEELERGQGRAPAAGRVLPADAGQLLAERRRRSRCGSASAILYRGPSDGRPPRRNRPMTEKLARQRAAAMDLLGTDDGLLELVDDADAYSRSVHDLVSARNRNARRVLHDPVRRTFPIHLTSKCDGCLYNEFCMKRARRRTTSRCCRTSPSPTSAPCSAGIPTVARTGRAQGPAQGGHVTVDGEIQDRTDLVPAAGKRSAGTHAGRHLAGRAAAGRADPPRRGYRSCKKEPSTAITYIPSKGYGSLPYSDAQPRTRTWCASTSMPSTTTCTTASTCSARWSSAARTGSTSPSGGAASFA